jgi:TonB-linked SusC/RagA family outer membrane protein
MKFRAISIAMPSAWPQIKQLLRIMKLSTLLLIIGLLQASAKGYSQVTLNEKHSPLEKVLQKIEKQTSYTFIYDEDKLNISAIDVSVFNVPVEKALDACFKNMPVSYSIIGNNIILKPTAPTFLDRVKEIFAGPVQVRGIITDTTGTPLNRATVFFIKKRNAVAVAVPAGVTANSNVPVMASVGEVFYVTGEDGIFYMDAEEGDELGVSYVGFKTYTFKVKKDMQFQRITLHSTAAQLKEVVVHTGYQTLSKERATGSFSKPDMKVFSARTGSMDVIGRLDGQIPGLTVSPQEDNYDVTTHTSSRSARVRGTSSINLLKEPLYVVNGVVVTNFSSINIDDVEDITVLKDAAAAAIWGAKAANGVVVVVTKSGNKNQKVKISYQGFVDFQGKPNLNYQRYLTSAQYIQAAKETFDPVAYPYSSLYYGMITPHEQILYDQNRGAITAAQANKGLDSLAGINNKQQILDLWYRNSFTTNHSITASGGNNYYNFYTSLGYTDVHGGNIGERNNTYRVNLNQTYSPNNRFSFSLSSSLANMVTSGKHPISIGADALPYQLFKDANGNNINMPYIYGYSPGLRANYQALSGIDLETYSPLDELNYGHSNSNNLEINLVGDASLKLWKGLSFKGTYGYTTSPGTNSGYDDHQEYALRKQLVSLTKPGVNGAAPTYLIPATGGNFRNSSTSQRSWTLRNQLVYTYTGRDGNDEINVQGGQEANETHRNSVTTNLAGYDEDLLTYPLIDYYTLSQGVPGTVTGYGYFGNQPYQVQDELTRYNSYFALASYTLNRKYSLDASWRVDHSNLFGSDVSAQNKPVYSFGGKWNISNESFLKPVTWINNLSLRVTYGITGNSPYVGAASTYDILYEPNGSYSSYPLVAGRAYDITQEKNDKLSWEATHTTNIGIDFGILDSRLSGTIEYYHKNTTDLLGSVPLDPFTGETSTTSNIGNLTNTGINIGLSSVNIRSGNFTWSSGVVFAVNTNKLVTYSAPQSYQSSASYQISNNYVLGYAVGPLFAYRYAGLDNVGDPQIKLADGTITKDPQKPTAKDLVYKGSIIPKMNGGITNNFRYKQFELSANMVYSLGAVMRRDVNQYYGGQRLSGSPQSFSGNVSADFADRWKKPGDENITDIPAYNVSGYYNYSQRNTQFYTQADINVVSASYLKLRETSIAYSLPASVTNLLKIQSATLRFQVNNILLWKANKYGIDPEFQSFQYGSRGTPTGQHSITLGANVNF